MSSDAPPAAPLEAAAIADVIESVVRAALAPVVGRLRALEAAAGELGAVRERIAALDARPAAVPGPPGPPGADGLGFDDYRLEYDGERTITHKWTRGEATAERAIKLPALIYRGVYVDGKGYERGDCVTWGGSLWHCNADTVIRPGDGAPAWTLAVKRGRDAKP